MTTPGNVASSSAGAATVNAVSAVRGNSAKGGEQSASGGFGDVLSDVQNGNGKGEKSGVVAADAGKRSNTATGAGARGGMAAAASSGSSDATRHFQAQIEDALESAVTDGAAEGQPQYQATASSAQTALAAVASELAAVIGAAQGGQANRVASSSDGDGVDAGTGTDVAARQGAQAALARIASVFNNSSGSAVASDPGNEAGMDVDAARAGAGNFAIGGRNKSGAAEAGAMPGAVADSPVDAATVAPEAIAESETAPRQTLRAQVVRQEAHFPPVMPQAPEGDGTVDAAGTATLEGVLPVVDELAMAGTRPAQQVADRIGAGIAADAVFSRHLAGEADPATPKPVLKVLQIQLQPADMGTVTVRMELKNEGLMVHVEASRSDTAELIRNDQDTLSKLLRSAGYAIDATSIRVVEGDRSGGSQQFSQQSGGQPQSQSSWQSQSGASDHQRQSGRGDSGDQAGNQGGQANRNDSNEASAHRSSGGLYL
ncbi:flagellar hook-length control protein FliK [Hyphomicrobium sp. D-2]|uniref:flagellar hook-length control protein FliK n=1 Tax=Hyphomicrobium sp. D-2 TaxID=3041621 RepID=UPI00245829CE|nr:flagellar hook-length control protein FliK [Hyphomicrobium sp. D-2]MDH4983663.1 flagellar hook-length control protein FliK [Hyphomicrobium sp. D-2]